ncbi:MAG: anti-sigma factor, partial [Chloroflexales bacterium]
DRPADGGPIWNARYQTLWYFDNDTLAPLRADIWLDRTNPARHRLQISHADGGAPYELQLGNGTDRLSYALNAQYAPVLYGSLPVSVALSQPALISAAADAPAQSRALAERISYGVWGVPLFYLRQAQAAQDLRVLGRQRDGGHTVQILSFSGVSPMGHPADAPGATAERVTVLLALDTADGRLRSASELAGPAGGAQTSRVTWKLIDEQSFSSRSDAGAPFDVDQAWNGQGTFPEALSHSIADPAVPLIPTASLGDPARLLATQPIPLWAPATPPAGVDRAMLVWRPSPDLPPDIIYLGPDRRLIMQFNNFSQIAAVEPLTIGLWSALLEPGRARGYRATLARQDSGGADPSASILIEAYGFSRAEFVAVIKSLRPLDADLLSAQDRLFIQPIR